MKVANLVLAGLLAAGTGCASGRPYSPGSTGGPGGSTPIPDTTPNLGSPAETPTGNSSSFRGNGPKLKMPEAFRDDPPVRSPRMSSRWNATAPNSQTSQYRPGQNQPGASTSPISTSDPLTLAGEPNWNRVYRSTDRRTIDSLQLGSGTQRIAILASLHGDETQSVALVEELARYFSEHREALRDTAVLLVRTANPDGLAAHPRSPYNVHGVDLNRNFPSANWKPLANARAGSKAGSETETRVAMRLIGDFHPTLLVHLKDSRDQSVVNREGNVGDRAETVARLVRGTAVAGLGAKTSGSIEHYANTQLKCPSLTLLLAVEASDQAAWVKNRDGLLATCGKTPPAGTETGALDDQTRPLDGGTIRNSSLQKQRPSTIDVTGRAPGKSRSTLPGSPGAVPEHGYLELPPP